jgi:hypothetical protein
MRSVLLLFVAMAIPVPSWAWEADVHYGLNYWLARKAGFKPHHAQILAEAAQSPDDGIFLPAIAGVAFIVASGDKGASINVQSAHFPSQAILPARPEARRVEANSAAAQKVKSLVTSESEISDESWLFDIGQRLHPFEDSWSHRGIPDIPFNPLVQIRPNLSWGHPCDRGGWSAHDADLTFLHVSEVLQMATEIWGIYQTILTSRSSLRGHPAENWDTVRADIQEFARASTQEQKTNWFNSFSDFKLTDYARSDFMSTTSLRKNGTEPTDARYYVEPCGRVHSPSPVGRLGSLVTRATAFSRITDEQSVRTLLTAFLTAWIVRQNIAQAVDMMVFKPNKISNIRETKDDWRVRQFVTLRSLLLEDHGIASDLHHGAVPLATQVPEFQELSQGASTDGARGRAVPLLAASAGTNTPTLKYQQYASLDEALLFPSAAALTPIKSRNPYLLLGSDVSVPAEARSGFFEENHCIAVFQFKLLPHDLGFILLHRNRGQWEITDVSIAAL